MHPVRQDAQRRRRMRPAGATLSAGARPPMHGPHSSPLLASPQSQSSRAVMEPAAEPEADRPASPASVPSPEVAASLRAAAQVQEEPEPAHRQQAGPGFALARRSLGGLLGGTKRLEGSAAERAEQRRRQEQEAAAAAASTAPRRREPAARGEPSAAAAPGAGGARTKNQKRRDSYKRAAERRQAAEAAKAGEGSPSAAESEEGGGSGPRVISWTGEWVCACGIAHSMYDGCAVRGCGAEAPCRNYLRGECNLEAGPCKFPHLPLDLPPRLPPSSEQVVRLYKHSIMYKPEGRRGRRGSGRGAGSSSSTGSTGGAAAAPSAASSGAAAGSAAPAAPAVVYVPVPVPMQSWAGGPGGGQSDSYAPQPAAPAPPERSASTEQQVAQLASLVQQVLSRLPPEEAAGLRAALPAGSTGDGEAAAQPQSQQAPAAGCQEEDGKAPLQAAQVAEPQVLPPHLTPFFPPATAGASAAGPRTPAGSAGQPAMGRTGSLPAADGSAPVAAAAPPPAPVALVRQLLPPAAAPTAPQDKARLPQSFICPITQELMQDPVMAADGHTYERAAISAWLQHCLAEAAPARRPAQLRSPMSNAPLEHAGLVPNLAVRAAIEELRQQQTRGVGGAPRGNGGSKAAAARATVSQHF